MQELTTDVRPGPGSGSVRRGNAAGTAVPGADEEGPVSRAVFEFDAATGAPLAVLPRVARRRLDLPVTATGTGSSARRRMLVAATPPSQATAPPMPAVSPSSAGAPAHCRGLPVAAGGRVPPSRAASPRSSSSASATQADALAGVEPCPQDAARIVDLELRLRATLDRLGRRTTEVRNLAARLAAAEGVVAPPGRAVLVEAGAGPPVAESRRAATCASASSAPAAARVTAASAAAATTAATAAAVAAVAAVARSVSPEEASGLAAHIDTLTAEIDRRDAALRDRDARVARLEREHAAALAEIQRLRGLVRPRTSSVADAGAAPPAVGAGTRPGTGTAPFAR